MIGERPVENSVVRARLPHVSVVVPTHRRPEAVMRCLRALLAQDYPGDRYDIHVVHNSSPDDTEARVAALRAETAVPLAYTLRNGAGPAPSRHHGGMTAKGEIIAFIDDDCEATPGWIRAGVAAFEAGVGLVQGATLPNPAHRRRLLEKTVMVPGPSGYYETCNIFYRKSAFLAVDGFSGAFAEMFYGEDTDLGRRVVRAGYESRFAPHALVHHDVTAQTLRAWLMECWHLRNLPLLVRRWPEMRKDMVLGVFLGRQNAAFALGVAGVATTPLLGVWAASFWLPFFLVRLVEPGRYRNPAAVVARSLLGAPRAAVAFAALLYGSFRHRTLVL